MPWVNTPDKRRQDAASYGPEYKANRKIARERANGHCEECGHSHRTQCDHAVPVTQGGSHHHSNLRMLCAGEGTCKCHERKTAQEGGGYRNPANRGRKTAGDPEPVRRTNW
jgi:5-methylcytosine-specific restriction endonuclease McrA